MEQERSLIQRLNNEETKVAVVGLGYVGLPLALEFAKIWKVVGFDIKPDRIALMQQGIDPSKELPTEAFENKKIEFTTDEAALSDCSVFVVAVPTPVDNRKVPDLGPLLGASETIGRHLNPGDIVIYESTVYPGCTEEDCVPILERNSGLTYIADFKVGYSPERINPGEREKTVEKITKVVSACDEEALKDVVALYESVITGGVYAASSIKVAEAAKVIENTQRDLNISFVNELSMIFDKMGIDTQEVIEAAGTKWNFMKYTPGLVGGHCIGVDPYYLLFKAKQLGHDPQVILSGRRINDEMPGYIAKRLVQKLIKKGRNPKDAKVLVLGITFKENVSDIRNSKVADLVDELQQYSVWVELADPHANPEEVKEEYGFALVEKIEGVFDAIIVAVGHQEYKILDKDFFIRHLNEETRLLFDLKGIYDLKNEPELTVWRL